MKKLKLNKETLRYLKDNEVGKIVAGASDSPSSCYTQCCATLTCWCVPTSNTCNFTGCA
jgi:hypothetical protein